MTDNKVPPELNENDNSIPDFEVQDDERTADTKNVSKEFQITHKQKMVCEYILRGCSIPEAHKKAGYATVTANQISKAKFYSNRGVQAYIRDRLKEIQIATSTDINWLIVSLKEKAIQGDMKAFELLTKLLQPELQKYGVEVNGDRSLKIEFTVLSRDNELNGQSENSTISIPTENNLQ